MGHMDEDRMRYSSSAINEKYNITAGNVSNKSIVLEWSPVLEVKGVKITPKEGPVQTLTIVSGAPNNNEVQVAIDKTSRVATLTFNASQAQFADGAVISTLYMYDNEIIPQTVTPNSLPTLTAKMQAVNLHAHARRIAVYYNNLIVA